MKEIYYVYNNEAISSCIFLSILNKIDQLDIARSCLILPFLLDDRTVSHFSKTIASQLELEQLIKENSRLFTSFNKRYLALLPVTINSLIVLSNSKQISITNSEIVAKSLLNLDNNDLGERFKKIAEVIPEFLLLIEKYSTSHLYKILKIQL